MRVFSQHRKVCCVNRRLKYSRIRTRCEIPAPDAVLRARYARQLPQELAERSSKQRAFIFGHAQLFPSFEQEFHSSQAQRKRRGRHRIGLRRTILSQSQLFAYEIPEYCKRFPRPGGQALAGTDDRWAARLREPRGELNRRVGPGYGDCMFRLGMSGRAGRRERRDVADQDEPERPEGPPQAEERCGQGRGAAALTSLETQLRAGLRGRQIQGAEWRRAVIRRSPGDVPASGSPAEHAVGEGRRSPDSSAYPRRSK